MKKQQLTRIDRLQKNQKAKSGRLKVVTVVAVQQTLLLSKSHEN